MRKYTSTFLVLIVLLITCSFGLRIRRQLLKEKDGSKYCFFARCYDDIDDELDDDDDLLKLESKNESSITN